MKVSIDDIMALPQQRLSVSFNEKLAGLEAIKPVLGDLTLAYSATGILLSGRVKTLLKLHCDRCLRPYFQALTVDIEERFVQPALLLENRETKERELHNDDFVEPLPENGILDISDVVYQAVTLATPSYCSCGAECPGPPQKDAQLSGSSSEQQGGKGAQPSHGALDPRWKNLKTLFPNEETSENS